MSLHPRYRLDLIVSKSGKYPLLHIWRWGRAQDGVFLFSVSPYSKGYTRILPNSLLHDGQVYNYNDFEDPELTRAHVAAFVLLCDQA